MEFSSTKSNVIQLHGTIGEFETNNSNIIIKYFSTIANNREDGSGYHELLKRLSPMREKTETSFIEDLQQLLQRDLNDNRVAKELIPYLINKEQIKSHVTFFPSILSVLMPSDFLQSRNNSEIAVKYPQVLVNSTTNEFSYEGRWTYEQYRDKEGNNIPLAMISINLSKTEIIVIDGQHRSNAFRAISRSFDGKGKNQIYQNFYSHLEQDLPSKLNADLPVTLIWFESKNIDETQIRPELISRQLFIDVNNTSKYISTSRLILLNDKNPSSLLTRFFYSYIAENYQFKNTSLSLFHSGFDYDDNLKNKTNQPSPFAILVPESINYAFDWLFFGDVNFNKLHKWKAGKSSVRKYKERLEDYFESFVGIVEIKQDNDNNDYKEVKTDRPLEEIETTFNQEFGRYYYNLLTSFPLCGPHFDACETLQLQKDERTGEWATESWQEAWDKLFKGGEGLYYVFRKLKPNQPGYQIFASAEKIINEFIKERNSKFNVKSDSVSKAYETFRSVAFQTGLIKAFDTFHRAMKTQFLESINNFQSRIEEIEKEVWVFALTEFKNNLIREIQPSDWPLFKNIILRIIQKEGEFYYSQDSNSPDVRIVTTKFISKVNDYVGANFNKKIQEITYDDIISSISIDEILNQVMIEVKSIFRHLKLSILDTDYKAFCIKYLRSKSLG